MQKQPRHIRLDASQHLSVRFLVGAQVSLEGDKKSTWETITRVVKFSDPRYGVVDITRGLLLQIVDNFNKGTYGQDIFLDVAHAPNAGAAAKIVKLAVEGNRLRGLMEWTPYGTDAVKNKGFTYLSIEYTDDYVDPETSEHRGPLMMGAGLVVRPAVKGNQPVDATRLSESGDETPLIIHPELQTKLLQELHMKHAQLLEKLRKTLQEKKLAASVIESLMLAAAESVKNVLEEAAATILLKAFEDTGIKLAEEIGGREVTLSVNVPAIAPGMTADQVIALMQAENQKAAAGVKALADKQAGNVKLLSDTIAAVTTFDADVKKALAEAVVELVTPEMTPEQVVKLAQVQITQGNQLAVARQLSALGFHAPLGSIGIPGISVPFEESKKLAGIYHDNLKLTSHFAEGKLRLSPKDNVFINKVLAEFDRLHSGQISNEVKMLSGGGTVNISDTNLPVGFRREVIREALSDLRVLELVQAMTDFSATVTTQIPYEVRDMSAVMNDGIVYEGQPIHRGGIGQFMDTAYILPMKLAMLISNEAIHFTQAAAINWDAMARNVESNARIMRELICRRIINELQRASDAFGAVAVPAESFTDQLGATSQVKTAAFPIVRAFQQRDLQGNTVGAAVNPITVVLGSAACLPYDGSNTQATGTYYRINSYNLGYLQFVNQLGVAVMPAATGTNTIAYSRATNVAKVDLDIAAGLTYEQQLNKVLQGIGARKALLSGQRFVTPDYLLMSPVLNDTITNAEQFALSRKRDGTDTSGDGDLERVKGLPSYGTNAPGVDLGDERIIIGQRGMLGYVVGKPFVTGQPFEAVDSQGRPIGKKQAYGEEYSAIKVPTPVAGRMTSLIAFSFTGR
ncbi:hypothetical protein [Herminiimonas sp. CN]|uniref:hypothetical protein n=1 Tax=Herminiimonas sp. CN TaxID=1349818 RepID=UPI0004743B02|nr:hypothetical protein [Herminiimonas sp. CN]